nr:hypothetical protein - Trypanosoma cruzi [Trypanosoma cruzi]
MIGVAFLRVHGAVIPIHDPLEGPQRPATTAAKVSVVARHEHLLRQSRQRVAGEKPLALNVANGGEGPARAAQSLVLDGCHGAFLAPILCRGRANNLHVHRHSRALLRRRKVRRAVVVAGPEFLAREVREGRDAEGRVWVCRGVQPRKKQVLPEHAQAERLLRGALVHPAVLLLEFCELRRQRLLRMQARRRRGDEARHDDQDGREQQRTRPARHYCLCGCVSFLVCLQQRHLQTVVACGR